eukprot:TRINITY_DN6834_c0_g2_i1.p1 TRINITY_DN6834_c0_g2~~TRINITY_DN6834_c0_g2_i1.p1  ORF type:complete len:716 (+),score=259.02 TRINITY_DN6834_c0_g2_i1:77-2224(+)
MVEFPLAAMTSRHHPETPTSPTAFPLITSLNMSEDRLKKLDQRLTGRLTGSPVASLNPLPQLEVPIAPNEENLEESDSQDEVNESVEKGDDDGNSLHAFADDGIIDDASKSKKRRKNFTPDEDRLILLGVEKFGDSDWKKILEFTRLDRNEGSVRTRYKKLKGVDRAGQDDTVGTPPAKARRVSEPAEAAKVKLIAPPPAAAGELERLRRLLEEKDRELAAKDAALRERDDGFRTQEAVLRQQLEARMKQEQDATSERFQLMRKALIDALRKQSQEAKEIARTKLIQESHRLGQIISERHGTIWTEAWVDGYAFKHLDQRANALAEAKKAVEEQTKEHLKRSKKKKAADGTPEPPTAADIEEAIQLEVLRIRAGALKKEEVTIQEERDKLLQEKNIHIREIKRTSDEDHSRFNSNLLMCKDRFLLLHLLGKGGFSEVYKAFDLQEFREVACKIHQLNTTWNERKKDNYIKHACREFAIHKAVDHPKIVRLLEVFEIDDNSFCTVLEYCDGPDLDLYLKTQGPLAERDAKSIVHQIFAGLLYLNERKQPIIHYDLKPGNILFQHGDVKITDFGLSKIMDENESMLDLTSQGAGTYWYLPPECFESAGPGLAPKISSKVDVWSVGVIFYQMLYGKKPFGNNVSQKKIIEENIIANSKLEFPPKPAVSQEAKDFITACLNPSQRDRPDVRTCFFGPYLARDASAKPRGTMGPPSARKV